MTNHLSSRGPKSLAIAGLIIGLAALAVWVGVLTIHALAAPDVRQVDAVAAPAPSSPAGPGMYDDTDPHFTYSGAWSSGSNFPNAYLNTMHASNDAHARASFSFRGTGFTLYRLTDDKGSLMLLNLDGKPYQLVHDNAASAKWQVPVTFNGLPDRAHV